MSGDRVSGGRRPRAGILVTGTEVLSGIIADRNGPWLSERLREVGVDASHIVIVGDRPADMEAALRWLAEQPPPTIIAPPGMEGAAYRLSVPNNAMDIVGRAWCRGNRQRRWWISRLPHVVSMARKRCSRRRPIPCCARSRRSN